MIIESTMNFFEFDSFNLFKFKREGNYMALSEKYCKSLKNVDKDVQRVKNNCAVDSVLNGVNPFKII